MKKPRYKFTQRHSTNGRDGNQILDAVWWTKAVKDGSRHHLQETLRESQVLEGRKGRRQPDGHRNPQRGKEREVRKEGPQ